MDEREREGESKDEAEIEKDGMKNEVWPKSHLLDRYQTKEYGSLLKLLLLSPLLWNKSLERRHLLGTFQSQDFYGDVASTGSTPWDKKLVSSSTSSKSLKHTETF